MLRRSVLLLPIVLVLTALPVARAPQRPAVRHWAMALRGAAPVRAPGTFGLVGVRWTPGAKAPKGVDVRTSTDGVRWTPWSELEVTDEEGPDRGTAEAARMSSTAPLWVGDSRHAQVRFDGAAPRGAAIELVDPGRDPAPPAASAYASPSKPGIITRAQWGADESMRRGKPEYAEPLQMAIIHHTATTNSYSKSESARIVRSIYAYHVRTNGWNDIGYNFLVDRYGQIFEGRFGGMDRTLIGAHAVGFNRHATGISVIGNFLGSKPPEAAMQALKRITAWRLDLGFVDAKGATTMVSGGSPKWAAGKRVSLKTISSHLDVGQTSCPGGPIYNSLPWLRSAVAGYGLPKFVGGKLTHQTITPNSDGFADGARLTGKFTRTMRWTVDVINSAGTVMTSTSGTGTTISIPFSGRNKAGKRVSQDTYRFRVKATSSVGSIRTAHLPFKLWRYMNGTLFTRGTNGSAYVLLGGRLRHLTTDQALLSRYARAEAIIVGPELLSVYPVGSDVGFREGSLVRAEGKYYVIADNMKRPTSESALKRIGYNVGSVRNTTLKALAPHANGSALTASSGYPNGAALEGDLGEALMVGSSPRPFMSANVRKSYAIRDIDRVGGADDAVAQAAARTPVKFRDGSLIRASGDPTIYLVADGQRHAFPSSKVFSAMGYKSANIRNVSAGELALQPEGAPL